MRRGARKDVGYRSSPSLLDQIRSSRPLLLSIASSIRSYSSCEISTAAYGGVRNKLVEVLHDHLLGQNRQTLGRTIGNPFVKAPIEGRVGVGVLPQQSELSGLVRLQLTTRPSVPLAQPVA